MKYIMLALLCLQMACKFELPKEPKSDSDQDGEGKVIFLGTIQENIDRVTVVNYVHNTPDIGELNSPLPDYPHQSFDWDFQINKLKLSGTCNLERAITPAEIDSIAGLIKKFNFCKFEGPERFPCPCYFGPLNQATASAANRRYEMIGSPYDCTDNTVICDPADSAKLTALIEQLTKNDIQSCN